MTEANNVPDAVAQEDDTELDGLFAFAIVSIGDGTYAIKPLEWYTDDDGNSVPYKFMREPTQDDLITSVTLLAKKFERQLLASDIVEMIRNTPGKIIVPKPGRGINR